MGAGPAEGGLEGAVQLVKRCGYGAGERAVYGWVGDFGGAEGEFEYVILGLAG